MENHMSLLDCLPKEVLYYYLARYLDLRDLGVLLFTSKHINELFQTDLALQKIICDATPMRITHKTKSRPIRMLYYEKIASMALKDDDASIMKYSLENLSAEHIIARLRPKQDFVITKKQKLDLLTHIISHDADKVLEFLIEECQKPDTPKKGNNTPIATWSTIERAIKPPSYVPHGVKMKYDGIDVELTPEQEEMASYIACLLDTPYISNLQFIKNFFADWLKVLNPPGTTTPHVIQKYELCDFKPIAKHLQNMKERQQHYNYVAIEKLFNFLVDDCFANPPENCTHQKVVAVVLKFINKHRRVLLRVLLQRISSEPKSIRLLQLMLKYSKYFKEYSIDINEPIEVKKDYVLPKDSSLVFEATPLEAAAFYGLKNVFHTLNEHKAVVDLKRPYLPLLCIDNLAEKEFFDFLVKLGADLNVFLPDTLAPKTTILGYLSKRFDPSYTRTKNIENLLLKGAKLSAEEAEQFLNDQDLFLQCVASAQLENYDPNTRTEILTFNGAATLTFRSISSRSILHLMSDGSCQYYIDGSKSDRVGQWKQISDIGRIWLTSDKEKRYQNWGSYGEGYVDVTVALAKYEFLIYRNFLNEIAVVLLGPDGEFDCSSILQMEHNAAFTALPIEIHHKYVRYIDLRDLGALMFTCKEFYELFGTDLQLQKIVYDRTEQRVLHDKLRRSIKTLFMENRALHALKIDDIEFLKYTMPSPSINDISLKLRTGSRDPKTLFTSQQKKKPTQHQRSNYLQKIFDYDAGKCFDFLLDAYLSDSNNTSDQIYNHLLLIAIFCFKPMLTLDSPSKLPYQKVLRVFLKHCQKQMDLILAKLVTPLATEILEETPSYSKMVFDSFVACKKEFPEFDIDISQKIPSNYFNNQDASTLLEYAAATCHHELFHYLLNNGAQFDPEAPYWSLAYRYTGRSQLLTDLEKLGAKVNVLLKPDNESLLHASIKYGWYTQRNLEYLLYKGAKLTKEEESHWLNSGPDNFQYRVAVCQRTEYNPLKTVGNIAAKLDLLEPGYYINFYGASAERISLYRDTRFKVNDMFGHWEVKDGKLFLHDTSPRQMPTRTFCVIKTCVSPGFALAIDDPKLSDEERMQNLLHASFTDRDY